MNIKRILAGILCVCLIGTGCVPAYAAENEVPVSAESVIETVAAEPVAATSDIPQVMLEQMGRDVKLKDFIRPVSIRDFIKFTKKMKKYYTTMDVSAKTLTSAGDLAYLDSACSSPANESIGIAPASLNGRPVTLLTLGGTCFKAGQASGIQEDLLSALEQSNRYLHNVVDIFDKTDENGQPLIPSDRPVIVTGISLGGMVAQQLLSQKDIMKRFDISHVICFGSPLLAPFSRDKGTTVVRFCDSMDIVPYLGRSAMIDMVRQELRNKNPLRYVQRLDKKEAIVKDGGYKTPISAHALSYVEGKCWNGYDALGVYGGGNQIKMEKDLQFFSNSVK